MTGDAAAGDTDSLDAVLPRLRCPVCRDTLVRADRRVRCPAGHSFDVARQGYLNLAVGQRAGTADSAGMVAARDVFLARNHYGPVADAVVAAVGGAEFVVDLAGGTGWYLARVLDATGGLGVCVDLSAPALRRAAHAHPRGAAIGADAWRALPLADRCAGAVLSIFGPRDAEEVDRVLERGGRFVTVSPEADHLTELVGPLGMIGVDPDKRVRAAVAFDRFEAAGEVDVRYGLRLGRDDAYSAAAMGPSAWHVADDELRARAAALPETVDVTVAVTVRVYRGSR